MGRLKINKFWLIIPALVFALVMSSGCLYIGGDFPDWLPTPEIEETPPAGTYDPPEATPIDPDWTAPLQDGNPALPDFVAVVSKVKPSVVAIRTDGGAGSGWIIREDGIIVTNNHVVTDSQNIAIALDDGRTFSAETVRTDPLTDLAIVKIDAEELPAADIGDSTTLQLGEPVAVIGNALGEGISMTGGWVSQVGVSLNVSPGQTLDDLIRTDAAINPGNSGGPLVNIAGEVIGITSVKIAQVGVEGFGYAISINEAKEVIDQLILRGYVIRSYLGVGLQTVNPIVAFFNNLPVNQGALVTTVASDSPAVGAGIEEGDVIVEFDGEAVTSAEQLITAIHDREIGQEVEIVYWRDETQNTTQAVLSESPPPS
jgi:serine protease Do